MKHDGRVFSAEFSPDGQRVVTASEDKTAQVWDAASGKPIGQSLKHDGRVFSAQFSPDGQRVVTASEDKTAQVWDAASGKPIGQRMKHENGVNQRNSVSMVNRCDRLMELHGAAVGCRQRQTNRRAHEA